MTPLSLSCFNIALKRFSSFVRISDCIRKYSSESGQTTVSVLNKDLKDILMIDSYSQVGFRLNIGVKVLGSIAIFPQTVYAWAIASERDVTDESFSLFRFLDPKLDILVLGYGDAGNKVKPSVIQSLTKRKIYVESLPTDQACTTYNFLAAEGRHVAAALIPPTLFRASDDDLIDTKVRQRRLYKVDTNVFGTND